MSWLNRIGVVIRIDLLHKRALFLVAENWAAAGGCTGHDGHSEPIRLFGEIAVWRRLSAADTVIDIPGSAVALAGASLRIRTSRRGPHRFRRAPSRRRNARMSTSPTVDGRFTESSSVNRDWPWGAPDQYCELRRLRPRRLRVYGRMMRRRCCDQRRPNACRRPWRRTVCRFHGQPPANSQFKIGMT